MLRDFSWGHIARFSLLADSCRVSSASSALGSAGRPWIPVLLPWSGGGPNARNKAALGCSPRGTAGSRRLGLRSAAESGGGEAAPRRPLSFFQAFRSTENGLGLHRDCPWFFPFTLLPWITHSQVPSPRVVTRKVSSK